MKSIDQPAFSLKITAWNKDKRWVTVLCGAGQTGLSHDSWEFSFGNYKVFFSYSEVKGKEKDS